MTSIELYVSLLIPDTTAITAFNALARMGIKLTKLKRHDYYKFVIDCDPAQFISDIQKVDVLVNANKHKAIVRKESDSSLKGIRVTDIGDECEGVLATLKDRLGFEGIKSMEKGTFWEFESELDDASMAKKLSESLLYNPNYQNYEYIGG